MLVISSLHAVSTLSQSCFLTATNLSEMLFAEESCVWVEEGVGNVAGAHRVKRNVVKIFVQILLVADDVIEKAGLPEVFG